MDPEFEIRVGIRNRGAEKTYSGYRFQGQVLKNHRIPGPDPQHCEQV